MWLEEKGKKLTSDSDDSPLEVGEAETEPKDESEIEKKDTEEEK